MKLSQTGFISTRLNNLNSMFPAQDLLMQSGQLVQYGSGIYAYDVVPLIVKRNIEKIVSKILNKYGCIEVSLPTLQPESIWRESGRWDKYINDGTMLTVKTDKSNFCMSPTAEEAVIFFSRNRLRSYKNLPVTFYQIGEKYRDELRNRGFLLRGKSFTMMDAYSFNTEESDLVESYKNLKEAYLEIFKELDLKVIPVGADNGSFGGKKSEEFMVLSENGEDTILVDKITNQGFNSEILEKQDAEQYLKNEYGINDLNNLEEKKSIELGHIFQLGTSFSESMNLVYTNSTGVSMPIYMGCYGIGISRTLALIYEKSILKDENNIVTGISLPFNLAPFKVQIVAKEDKVESAFELYKLLENNNIECIIDDRENISFGAKIKDCRVLGTPYVAILGDKVKENEIELENTLTNEKTMLTFEELVNKLK